MEAKGGLAQDREQQGGRMKSREYFRFRWSHRSPVHIFLVKIYNAIMARVPFKVKYSIGKKLRASKPPYCLVRPGSVVVQVGAPRDTLRAGRSRAMYFTLFTAPNGRVVIVEPASASIEEFRRTLAAQGLHHVDLHELGAWSEHTTLRLRIDDSHPAANFTEGTADYSEEELKNFRLVEMETDSVDNILRASGVEKADLVSITTNGAEREILEGLRSTMAKGLEYICLACTGPEYVELMREYGYELATYDDRGYTFRQVANNTSA